MRFQRTRQKGKAVVVLTNSSKLKYENKKMATIQNGIGMMNDYKVFGTKCFLLNCIQQSHETNKLYMHV